MNDSPNNTPFNPDETINPGFNVVCRAYLNRPIRRVRLIYQYDKLHDFNNHWCIAHCIEHSRSPCRGDSHEYHLKLNRFIKLRQGDYIQLCKTEKDFLNSHNTFLYIQDQSTQKRIDNLIESSKHPDELLTTSMCTKISTGKPPCRDYYYMCFVYYREKCIFMIKGSKCVKLLIKAAKITNISHSGDDIEHLKRIKEVST